MLKVLRDEEKHAREVEAANQRRKRSRHQDEDDDNIKNLAPNGHFSLFAKEEKEAHLEQAEKMKENDRKNKQQHLRPFDQSTSVAMMDAAVGLKSRQHKHSRRDVAAKKRLDPMSDFCRNYQDPKSNKKSDEKKNSRRLENDAVDISQSREGGKPSESEGYRGRSHRRRRRKSHSSSSSSSSSDNSLSSPSSHKRRRKRRREDSKSRKGRYTSSSLSSDDASSQHDAHHRRRGRCSKSKHKRKNRTKSNNEGRSTPISKEENAKRELLLRCSQREEEERLRQVNLQY